VIRKLGTRFLLAWAALRGNAIVYGVQIRGTLYLPVGDAVLIDVNIEAINRGQRYGVVCGRPMLSNKGASL
jgi:hypothetical protein